ncbi:hypothetical protein [Paenibacillus glycanilyticus]|uniref:hypothetical protein n=1 Tax=Paenibacillus glycanilyticus TaxID=126569 RepID=UPI003EBBACF1
MINSKEFEFWLLNKNNETTGIGLSKSSAYKYSRAINSISKDMIKWGIIKENLYNITSLYDLMENIDLIKGNEYFIRKNIKGHNMYSVALDHYLDFIHVTILKPLNNQE